MDEIYSFSVRTQDDWFAYSIWVRENVPRGNYFLTKPDDIAYLNGWVQFKHESDAVAFKLKFKV